MGDHMMLHTYNISTQLNEEDGDAAQRQRDAGCDVDEVGGQFWNVLGQGVGNGLLQIVKDQTPWRNQKQKNFLQ